jgi:hypothetical protein
VWSEDGQELFHWGPAEKMSVQIDTRPDFRVKRPESLFAHQDYVFSGSQNYDLDRAVDS